MSKEVPPPSRAGLWPSRWRGAGLCQPGRDLSSIKWRGAVSCVCLCVQGAAAGGTSQQNTPPHLKPERWGAGMQPSCLILHSFLSSSTTSGSYLQEIGGTTGFLRHPSGAAAGEAKLSLGVLSAISGLWAGCSVHRARPESRLMSCKNMGEWPAPSPFPCSPQVTAYTGGMALCCPLCIPPGSSHSPGPAGICSATSSLL